MPWLLNVVVDVAQEDEADPRADHDAVLKVLADKGIPVLELLVVRHLIAALPYEDELLSQAIYEHKRIADHKNYHLVAASSKLLAFLDLRFFISDLLHQILVICHEHLVFVRHEAFFEWRMWNVAALAEGSACF